MPKSKVCHCFWENCDAVYNSEEDTYLHALQTHSTKGNQECLWISSEIKGLSIRVSLRVSHFSLDFRPLSCPLCQKKIRSRQELGRHKKTHLSSDFNEGMEEIGNHLFDAESPPLDDVAAHYFDVKDADSYLRRQQADSFISSSINAEINSNKTMLIPKSNKVNFYTLDSFIDDNECEDDDVKEFCEVLDVDASPEVNKEIRLLAEVDEDALSLPLVSIDKKKIVLHKYQIEILKRDSKFPLSINPPSSFLVGITCGLFWGMCVELTRDFSIDIPEEIKTTVLRVAEREGILAPQFQIELQYYLVNKNNIPLSKLIEHRRQSVNTNFGRLILSIVKVLTFELNSEMEKMNLVITETASNEDEFEWFEPIEGSPLFKSPSDCSAAAILLKYTITYHTDSINLSLRKAATKRLGECLKMEIQKLVKTIIFGNNKNCRKLCCFGLLCNQGDTLFNENFFDFGKSEIFIWLRLGSDLNYVINNDIEFDDFKDLVGVKLLKIE
ncbi:hypothetical protein HK099_006317 [Clydaea vesicula]|uniref:C2H2-type domain-containing protein n=1 Tax=Clydaea vesicula TaxID=447962 RepID=A0AAD5U1B3_9FUNG|nr:hypothetical protein HK099_006317 [Clydaea vesicula]